MDNKEEKKIDPGWNDPPMLNYSPSNPPPKSRITNKRVAFPLSSNNTNTSNSPSLPTRPLPSTLPVSSTLVQTPLKPVELLPEQELLKVVRDNFDKLLLNNSDQTMKESTQLLYKRWEEKKFTKDCETNIYYLSKFLVENDKISAQQIKEKLLVEFKTLCEEWLSSIII